MSGTSAKVRLSPYEAGNDLNLPDGWVYCKIGDILKVNYGKGLKEVKRNPGNISVYGSNGIVGQHNIALTKGPTIIIGRKGSVGVVHFSKEPCWPIDTTYFIDALDDLSPIYLLHVLRGLTLSDLDTSTAIPGLNRNDLYDQPIPLPPLPEQKRIAAKVEELLARVNATKERLAKVAAILKRFRQSVLATASSGQLTVDWRTSKKNTEQRGAIIRRIIDTHDLAGIGHGGTAAPPTEGVHNLVEDEIPETWALAELKWLCEPGRSITYGILKPGPNQIEGVPYIRVADFPNGKLLLDKIRKTTNEIAGQYERSALRAGDILLSIRGTVGRVCRVPKELDGANITQDSARISVHPEISADYLEIYLKSPTVQHRLDGAMKGVAVRGVNIGDVRALQISVPPLFEQSEIFRRVHSLFAFADAIDKRVTMAESRAENLSQATLAKAFRGELVPTEAELARREGRSYEPASALLACIKDEHTQKGSNFRPLPRAQKRT